MLQCICTDAVEVAAGAKGFTGTGGPPVGGGG